MKNDDTVTIGRSEEEDFFLDSTITPKLISRKHASVTGSIQYNGDVQFTIVNHGINGTYINDIKVFITLFFLVNSNFSFELL